MKSSQWKAQRTGVILCSRCNRENARDEPAWVQPSAVEKTFKNVGISKLFEGRHQCENLDHLSHIGYCVGELLLPIIIPTYELLDDLQQLFRRHR